MQQRSKDARMRFIANVERLCRQHGYSTDRLAERSGIAKEELEAVLGGDAEADVESIYRLAGALEVSPGALYEGVAWIPDGEGGGEYRIEEPSGD
jgi:transcriptional regulator with XRE-family HTH domain